MKSALRDYLDNRQLITHQQNTIVITIRQYRESDTPALAAIYYETIHRINSQDYSEEQLDAWAPKSSLEPAGWQETFARTKPFVPVVEKQVAGFAELERRGYIDCFYVHHEWVESWREAWPPAK